MGLFKDIFGAGSQSESDSSPSRDYVAATNGAPRKITLVLAIVNRVKDIAICEPNAWADPLADNYRLPEATGVVRDVLHQDRSMAAWVARDTMMVFGDIVGTAGERFECGLAAAGLRPGPALLPEAESSLPTDVQDRATGLATYALALLRVVSNGGSTGDRELYNHVYSSQDPRTFETALDVIAWASTILGRLRNTGRLDGDFALFDVRHQSFVEMEVPGWYPNPYNAGQIVDGDATFQREWDGSDWTSQIRVRQDQRWIRQERSMFDPPNN